MTKRSRNTHVFIRFILRALKSTQNRPTVAAVWSKNGKMRFINQGKNFGIGCDLIWAGKMLERALLKSKGK